jgi:hypothetical protein
MDSPEIPRPILWLRGEGLAVLLLSFFLYSQHEAGWLMFVVLFFVPDLSMLGYLSGPRTGALFYNLAHTYTAPILLASSGLITSNALLIALALIWSAHIGLDRMLGYGLKKDSAFQDTHLGRIGGPAGGTGGSD